jgi:hypothetical protein
MSCRRTGGAARGVEPAAIVAEVVNPRPSTDVDLEPPHPTGTIAPAAATIGSPGDRRYVAAPLLPFPSMYSVRPLDALSE